MLTFSYSVEKDADNIIVASKSVNMPQQTEVQRLYAVQHGNDFEKEKVVKFGQEYLKTNTIYTVQAVETIEQKWRPIEASFIKRANDIFGVNFTNRPIQVYLTIDDRCTYNIKKNYFFVRISGKESNRTIMHELLHFYTWERFGDMNIDSKTYNDVKESLTELLNIEFVDLMDGATDKGYPQHQEMRKKVRELWCETRDVGKVVEEFIKCR